MPASNREIAAIFEQIADLLEIEAANPFRVRAYRNAARSVSALTQELAETLPDGEDLTRLPDIGKELAAKIQEIIETGHCRALDKLHGTLPTELSELLHLPGLGPKRVHALYHELDIRSPDQLYEAAQAGRLQSIPGFGAKTEQRLLEALEARRQHARRFGRALAAAHAEPLVAYLLRTPGVRQVVVAGSFRRCQETVGDLDILATAEGPEPIMTHFVHSPEVQRTESQGPTRATVRLRCGLQVDLRVVESASFGAALHYFTGSKAHNIAVRRLGQQRGLKINEYGVFRGNQRIAGETEVSVFESLGLPYIEPELREDRGEIGAAQANRLPKLVKLRHLQGDLHLHTSASDGRDSIEALARVAREHGLQYLAITDHASQLAVAHGLSSERLLRQMEEIDHLNGILRGVTILKGVEVDILEDGRLDLPDAVLGRLDLVIGAVHEHFELSRDRQTERILRAMDHPHFSLLAHPTGRLLEQREPYDVDLPRIIQHARERGCFLELNANPRRLDLGDTFCQLAKEHGVLVSINSDAHRSADIANLRYGIGQARRGWLSKKDVLNTQPLETLRPLLRATMR